MSCAGAALAGGAPVVPRRSRTRGFSLIEIMVVVAIVGLMMGSAVYGVRSMTRSELRGSASKLAGAIRYCFDRAITTGSYYRIVMDLDANRYWAERSTERMFIGRDKEQTKGKGRAFDLDAQERARDEQEASEQELADPTGGGVLAPPPRPKRARFQTFKDTTLPTITLKRIRLFDVYTRRQPEPYTQGRAYLYFFPDGHTERALVHLTDGDNFYSLLVHPLTGRVEVRSERVELPRDFDTRGEDGRR